MVDVLLGFVLYCFDFVVEEFVVGIVLGGDWFGVEIGGGFYF